MKAERIFAVIFLIIIISLVGFLIFQRENIERLTEGSLHPAKYYQKLSNDMVQCFLCPNKCILSSGQIGICKARKNVEGELYSMVYGKIVSAHLDPIEKKPLFHFLPGTKAYSIATTGCNLQCKFCQNWQIAQVFPWDVQTQDMTPEEVVEEALKSRAKTIAYTYTEPTVFYEYMFDIAKLAHKNGLKNVVISAGYISPEPLRDLLPHIDAYKIDFKGFNDKFYQKMTITGQVAPILEAMKIIKESGTWLEIVNLVIPGENDSNQDLMGLIEWVRDNLGPDVPLHFSRFHPDYKLTNTPPTPKETLKKARQMALDAGLNYVYIGNIADPESSSTYCPETGEVVIQRQGFFVTKDDLKENQCQIPGIWE